jgi:hypothetical protein
MRKDLLPNRLSVNELLTKARRRELTRLVLDKAALAAVVLMAGMILLLLAGTEFLAWYWPMLVAVISLGVAVYRLRASIPSLYRVAQGIDGRLKLADELSTAHYFSEHPREDLKAICERQRAHAETIAREVDLKQAIPFERSRFLAPAAGLALVALGLFGVRFLFTGNLSLQPSLVRLAYDTFFNNKPYAQNKPPRAKLDPQASGDNQQNRDGKEDSPDDLLDSADTPDSTNTTADNADNAQDGKQGDKQDSEKGKQDQNPNGDPSKQGNDPADQNQQQDSKQGDQNDKDAKPSNNNNQNASMMDKLRDALNNMLNKMKQNSEGKDSQKNSQQQGQPGDRQDQGQKNQQQSKEQAQNANNGDQQGQDSDQQDQGDNKANQSSDKDSKQASESGAGVKNGDKAIREAEQLQAMGKISEILGKRSANVTGEVMIEVGSSKQQLKTQWTQKQANHSEAGGEIHRDEVPLLYQPFVEQYFEEIRKGAPATAAQPKRPSKSPAKAVPQAE